MSIEDTPPSGDASPAPGSEPRQTASGGVELPVGDPTAMLTSTRERVQKVLSATDEAARSILEAAKAEADGHVRETQRRVEQLARARMEKLSTVTEDLLGQADKVRQEVDGLRRAIDGATAALAADLGLAPGEASSEPAPPPSAPGSPPTPTVAPAGAGAPSQSSWLDGLAPPAGAAHPDPSPETHRSEAVRESGLPSEVIEIFVLKMLATGSDREAIERRLAEEFAVENPAAVLARLGLTTPQPGNQA